LCASFQLPPHYRPLADSAPLPHPVRTPFKIRYQRMHEYPQITNKQRNNSWAPSSLSNVSSGHWVTVFGFAPESFPQLLRALQPSSSAALAHAQGGGNWAHLRLGSELEVEEALAKNGRLVCGNMIGILRGILPTPADADAAAALHQSAKQTVWLAAAAPAIDARAQVLSSPNPALVPGATCPFVLGGVITTIYPATLSLSRRIKTSDSE